MKFLFKTFKTAFKIFVCVSDQTQYYIKNDRFFEQTIFRLSMKIVVENLCFNLFRLDKLDIFISIPRR